MPPALLSALSSVLEFFEGNFPTAAAVAGRVAASVWSKFTSTALEHDHEVVNDVIGNVAHAIEDGSHVLVQFAAGDLAKLQAVVAEAKAAPAAAPAAPPAAEAPPAPQPAAPAAPVPAAPKP